MASPASDHGAAHQPRALLLFSSDKLRIPDELAGLIDGGGGGGGGEQRPTALVVGPLGKVWRVEVARDGDGAFLGRGWPEFAGAHGAGAGWFVALRHHGGGVLTVKAFDGSRCLKEYGAPAAAVQTTRMTIIKGAPRKPQFISVPQSDIKEKMIIPAKFVQDYISKELLNKQMAVVLGPLGKFWRIELEMNLSGMFFAGDGWSQFVASHGITEDNALLLRYEGNMVFTVKVFGSDGCQIVSEDKDIRDQQNNGEQQESPYSSGRKRKSQNEGPRGEENKRPKGPMASVNKGLNWRKSYYEIGQPSWIKKEINKHTLEKHLSLAGAFSNAIGLQEPCMITIKTSMNSTRSWQVRCHPYKNNNSLIQSGWKQFCKENKLKEGDVCTFNVMETKLWHVDIMRYVPKQQELRCSSSRKSASKNGCPSSQGPKRPKESMPTSNQASINLRCAYKIGPPSWIKKKINTNALEHSLSLAPAFCDAIGFREPCTIKLKSSVNSTKYWEVCGTPYKNSSHKLGSGWKKFSEDNSLKEGDVCTFNIVHTTLWHVDISRYIFQSHSNHLLVGTVRAKLTGQVMKERKDLKIQ
ncbi:hypothetical protein ACP4OV_020375 [Aristida adscensionis]